MVLVLLTMIVCEGVLYDGYDAVLFAARTQQPTGDTAALSGTTSTSSGRWPPGPTERKGVQPQGLCFGWSMEQGW